MKKCMFSVGFVFTLSAFATACASSDAQNAASTGAADQAITISAKNFEFDQKEIRLKKGDTVRFTLKNSQGRHAIHIDGYDKDIKDNDTVTFTANRTGRFKFVCSNMCGNGHSDMVGTLIVE